MPIRDDDEHMADFQSLAELAEAFTELVAALCAPGRSALTPTQVVDLAVRCMPRAQHAALVALVDGDVQNLAVTGDLPAAIDRIRAETGEGPAFDLIEGNDLIVVDHFLWHQHFNDDPDNTAKVVRIHMFDSLLETMRVLADPLVLFEEPPDHIRDAQAGDVSTVQWPAAERPTWP